MVDIEYVKNNIRPGWQLNPNEKVVNGIIKGINRCNGDGPCNTMQKNYIVHAQITD